MRYVPVVNCRLCGSGLAPLLSLGEQAMTGVFPVPGASVPIAPLDLVRCVGSCGLVQLAGTCSLESMYGDNYGYRSGLNGSMVRHLRQKAEKLQALVDLSPGDVVLDIGSNDGTSLGFYPRELTLVGIDPTAARFAGYYRSDIRRHEGFFSAEAFRAIAGDARARVVTSISMFYDLPDPLAFARDVAAILADDGVWHLEQSYLPLMLSRNSYDTVCHEHLEYYGLTQVIWILDRVGLGVVDIELNDVNGGSFAVTAKRGAAHDSRVQALLERERRELNDDAWARFARFVAAHRERLPRELQRLRDEGQRVYGIGASTKGNVLLQACGITPALLPAIGEVNRDKVGHLTPGSGIPICAEEDVMAMKPDVLLVLPWHFRPHMMEVFGAWVARGGRLLFPLPDIEMWGAG